MQAGVSANLITLNEERNIAACLESLRWADEVVVVDGGSRDRTVELARRYTKHVHVHPFQDFASQRNLAIQKSSGEWILSVDADERISAALAREIRAELSVVPGSCAGFWVPIRSSIFRRKFRGCGTQTERKMRLFRRVAGRWRGAVHETVELQGCTRQLRHAIAHESTASVEDYLRKLMRYSSIQADRMVASGMRPRWWRSWVIPAMTFSRLYFAKLGMLDGPAGFRFCLLSAWESWISYQRFLDRIRDHAGQIPGPHDSNMPVKEERHEEIPVRV
jgi:glycosyltransferase involved in cell wall biosynthesis